MKIEHLCRNCGFLLLKSEMDEGSPLAINIDCGNCRKTNYVRVNTKKNQFSRLRSRNVILET